MITRTKTKPDKLLSRILILTTSALAVAGFALMVSYGQIDSHLTPTALATEAVAVKATKNQNQGASDVTASSVSQGPSQESAVSTASTSSNTERQVSHSQQLPPRTLIVKGTQIHWENEIGQAGIDANHQIATTWGGAYDSTGSRPTLIAGHDDGPMGIVTSLGVNDTITAIGDDGASRSYKVVSKRVIEMDFDGTGSGFVRHQSDEDYLAGYLDYGSYLNLQVCVDYRADGYSICLVSLMPA